MSVRQVEAVRDWLISFFQAHPLFQKYAIDHYSKVSENGVGIKLQLVPDTNTHTTCYFEYDSDGKENEKKLTATVSMIESDLGHSTGFFLFHLQLVIAVIAGATEITLDNDTDNVLRARKGIYQLFRVNDRTMNRDERARMTVARWATKPEMYHKVGRTSLPRIERLILEKVAKAVEASHTVWREDAVEHLSLMFRQLKKQFDLYQGGARTRTRTGARTGARTRTRTGTRTGARTGTKRKKRRTISRRYL